LYFGKWCFFVALGTIYLFDMDITTAFGQTRYVVFYTMKNAGLF